MSKNITELLPVLVTVVGAIAFAVSVITESIKNMSFLKGVPTDVVVLVLSIALTVTSYIAYAQYVALAVVWYVIVAAVVCGFFVAFVAMYGWSKLTELFTRFNIK